MKISKITNASSIYNEMFLHTQALDMLWFFYYTLFTRYRIIQLRIAFLHNDEPTQT